MPPNHSILITGCSSPSGIGFASARALAGAGHSVHATVRDHTHEQALVEGLEERLFVHDLDLLDRASMIRTVGDVVAAEGRLDVLINNAGYGLIGGVEQVELELARANLETNFLGTAALMQEVLPVMRRQRGGHIVNVSTIFSAGLCPPAIGYYVASKAALEALSQALAIEAAPWDVRITNFQPGPVMTDLSRQWGQRLTGDEDPRPTLADELYAWVQAEDGPGVQSPAEVAVALQELVESDPPPLAGQTGPESEAYVAGALRDPTRRRELSALLQAFAPGCEHNAMSETNVELARRGWEAALRGDLDTLGELLDPDVKWHAGDPSAAYACHNRAEALEFMRAGRIRQSRPKLVDVTGAGDKVVVVTRRVSEDGDPVLSANLTTFRDGKAVEMVHYLDADDALAAARAEP